MKKIIFALLATAITVFALDINKASKEELVAVKGIGEKKAEQIISYRNEHGKFKSIEDLKNVKGIGDKIIEEVKKAS